MLRASMPCFQLFHVGSLDHVTWKIDYNAMHILPLKALVGQPPTKVCCVVIPIAVHVKCINYLKNAQARSNLSKKLQILDVDGLGSGIKSHLQHYAFMGMV